MQHFLCFGTHPRLSYAEFLAVAPEARMHVVDSGALVEDDGWDGEALMNRLGGTVKLGDVIATYRYDDFDEDALAEQLLEIRVPQRAVFGWTVIGGAANARHKFQRAGIALKRAFTKRGKSARLVSSKGGEALSPAAVAKMNLTEDGYDLVVFLEPKQVTVGLTTHVQDADAWSERDYGRPIRDDVNGMLPPKLARMMVNLARVPNDGTLLDPFCGSGTIAMEAALGTKAARIIGSDIETRQVESTKHNTDWLAMKHIITSDDRARIETFVADAREIGARLKPQSVDAVATEGYLGPPLRGREPRATLERNAKEITELWRETLTALRPILKSGARVVMVWPSFKSDRGEIAVDLSGEAGALGYRMTQKPLLYRRPDQRVSRQIVVFERQ